MTICTRFYAVPVEEFITKARHLSVLKDNATMLDGYYREGEPLRLGLGLYPGERIRQPVLRAIRDWRPPEQKMEVTASLQVQTVRLDSMSLFGRRTGPPERRLDKSAGGCAGEHPGQNRAG